MHVIFLMDLFIIYLAGGDSLTLRSIQNPDLEPSTSYSNLLKEIAESQFGHCHRVILSNPAENLLLEETRIKFQKKSGISILYDWSHLRNPPKQNTLGLTQLSGSQTQGPFLTTDADSDFCVAYFINTMKSFLPQLAKDMAETNWFPAAARYIVILMDEAISNTNVIQLSNDIGLLFHVIVIAPSLTNYSSQKLIITEICKFCHNGNSGIIEKGFWNSTSLVVKAPLIDDLSTNFQLHKFKICGYPSSLYFNIYKENDKFVLADSFDLRLFNVLAAFYNFTYEVLKPIDEQVGYQLENGSYTGLIGMVQRREADITCAIAISLQRNMAIKLSIQFSEEQLTLIFGKPKATQYWKSPMRPFTNTVWLCIIMVVVISALIFKFLQKNQKENGNSLTELSFELLGSLLTQHFQWNLSMSSRWFIASFLLFGMVISKIYVSNLVAYLTIPIVSPVINTLEELVQSDFSWGTENLAGAIYELLKTGQVPIYKKIIKKMEKCADTNECMTRAIQGHFAYISWKISNSQIIAQNFTNYDGEPMVEFAKEEFYTSGVGYGFQKGSLLAKPFDKVIQRLREAGILQFWLTKLIQMKNPNSKKSIPKESLRKLFSNCTRIYQDYL